jgi:hypothetical protein
MPQIRQPADPTMAIARYKEKTAAAGADWQKGVLNPRKDFKSEALKANGRWKNSMQAAIAADKFAKGIGRVDLAQFDATVNALGASVYQNGIAAKMPKAEAALARELPITAAVAATVNAMPGDTPEQRAEKAKQFALLRGKAAQK